MRNVEMFRLYNDIIKTLYIEMKNTARRLFVSDTEDDRFFQRYIYNITK